MTALAFADAETRSLIDVTQVGAYRYAKHHSTRSLVWSWVIDDGPGRVWSPDWAWSGQNNEIEELYDHIRSGGYFVAWNAFFDRWIWNETMVEIHGAPELPLEQVLCAQAQAEANNLPGSLDKAAICIGAAHQKDPQGARLISLLSNGDVTNWDSDNDHPDRMGRFRRYGLSDVYTMRDIWQCTRPLTLSEWHEYHASERVNDRGVAIDLEFAKCAKEYATEEFADLNAQLAEVCDDSRMTITNHVRKARWVHDQLYPSEELQAMTRRPPKKKDGPERFSCDRATREILLELLADPVYGDVFHVEHKERIIEFLEIIEAGNSAAVRKFTAMVNQEVGGRVYGQYSFNGAGQTGRFSSRGIQIHNLIRSPLDKENADRAVDAIEDVIAGRHPDELVNTYRLPLSRLLARLIRPTFIAPEGTELVWADYDQIEGRVLPWLAQSPGGEAKLDLYRNDIDTYRVAAMAIFALSAPESVSDSQRQVGKVAELALGFGGGVGALMAMARGYGVALTTDEAKRIVATWRSQNAWAQDFWNMLWEATIGAYRHPMTWYPAGRVSYLFHPDVMYGTLICKLPSGRWIVYPQFERERVEYEDADGVVRNKLRTSFVKGFSNGAARVDLWHGVLAENITQAVAADFLRGSLVALDTIGPPVVLHTHDEIVCEVPEGKGVKIAPDWIKGEMERLPDWAKGLPLSVSVEHGPYYTK